MIRGSADALRSGSFSCLSSFSVPSKAEIILDIPDGSTSAIKRASSPSDIPTGALISYNTPAPAAEGYDLASYFVDGEAPRRGSPEYRSEHQGRLYFFADAANRELFAANPERYLPQYDGFCAYAMARGSRIKGDPRVYRIEGGRLFFNLNARVHAQWERDIADRIRRADEYWRAGHASKGA